MEPYLLWVIGYLTWFAVLLFNASAWNKSSLKLKGLAGPMKAYWAETAIYIFFSFIFTTVLLILVAFDELPITLLVGDSVSVGKLLMSCLASLNVELVMNAWRRTSKPAFGVKEG